MTCVAWDGVNLVADRRILNGYCKSASITKIHKTDKGLYGFAGNLMPCMAMLEWIKPGSKLKDLPNLGPEDEYSILFIDNKGKMYGDESSPYAYSFDLPFYAMGSASQYAMATMHLGYDAFRAVKVACQLDVSCGNGVDSLSL